MGKKHQKIKNTAILFELLSRQITVDVLAGNSNSNAIAIVKEFFGKTTKLGKENRLYQILLNEKYKSENKANHLIDEVLKSRKKISSGLLKREKYNLIKEIKKHYPLEEFFRTKLSNYKLLASIYNIMEGKNDPSKNVRSRYTIVENITQKQSKNIKKQETLITEYGKQEKDLRLLVYKTLIDRFNEKYSSLNAVQKKLLKEYIYNMSNTNKLSEYMELQSNKVKKQLQKLIAGVSDKVTKIKLKETINQIDKLTHGKVIKDNHVISLMRYYELVKEIKKVNKR